MEELGHCNQYDGSNGFGQSLGKEFAESIKVGMESLGNGLKSHGKDAAAELKSFGKDAAAELKSFGKDAAAELKSFGKDAAAELKSFGFYIFLSTVVICFTTIGAIFYMMKGNTMAVSLNHSGKISLDGQRGIELHSTHE